MVVPCQYEIGLLELLKLNERELGDCKIYLVSEVEWDASRALHKCALRWPKGIVLVVMVNLSLNYESGL